MQGTSIQNIIPNFDISVAIWNSGPIVTKLVISTSCILIRYIDKTYMEVMQNSVVEARLVVSGILCAGRKPKNVQLV